MVVLPLPWSSCSADCPATIVAECCRSAAVDRGGASRAATVIAIGCLVAARGSGAGGLAAVVAEACLR